MELFTDKEKCCGCQACVVRCPKSAISMVDDNEGFLYPRIKTAMCVDCGICKNVCMFQNIASIESVKNKFIRCFAVKHKDKATRMASRSGGIFTAISDLILGAGGVLYGAVLSQSLEVIHVRAESKLERNRMRGSKYVQSRTDSSIYMQIKKDVENGRTVLFSGTSCQVAAVKGLFREIPDNLLLMDIVCHGVPSPRVYRDYIEWWEKRVGTIATGIDFRNKGNFGWSTHIESMYFGKMRKDSCVYTDLFYGHNTLRPSCYSCPYKDINHPGDITIADYWGIDNAAPGFNDDKGVSLVLINSAKGERYFSEAVNAGSIIYQETDIEKSMQPPLKESFKCPESRETFWLDYDKLDFDGTIRKYAPHSRRTYLKYRIKQILVALNLYKIRR
ncbi:MAG: Coenzyme F420 hydrogenase/dehydrogenase, beta subunit C-terminal domain [Oscillospiraceae bacterium]|nr:Coenzyme F420 hydrogenase/dehydrogenase, beta subunit C-terminal domain [Oscillospiraceae bacterium]